MKTKPKKKVRKLSPMESRNRQVRATNRQEKLERQEQRLAQQMTGRTGIVLGEPYASSPPPPAPPAAAEFVIVERDLPQLDPVYQQLLIDLVADRQTYRQTEKSGKDAEDRRKEYDANIRDMVMAQSGCNKINLSDAVVEECRGTTPSTISATRLLELGVDPLLINQATVPGAPYFFVKVRSRTKAERKAYDLRHAAATGQEGVTV